MFHQSTSWAAACVDAVSHLYVASRSMEGVTPRITPPSPSSRTMAARVAVRPGGRARSAVAVQLPLAAAAAAASSLYTCILHGSGGSIRSWMLNGIGLEGCCHRSAGVH